MNLFINIFTIFCSLATLSVADITDGQRDAFIMGCKDAITPKNMVSQISRLTDLGGDLRNIYHNHSSFLSSNEKFKETICSDLGDIIIEQPDLLAKVLLESNDSKEFSRTASDLQAQLLNEYTSLGLRRMNGASTIPYFSYLKDSFIGADPLLCRLLMVGAGDLASDSYSLQSLLLKQQQKMTSERVRNYLELTRAAIDVIVNDIGENISLTSTDEITAGEEFGDYLFKYSASFKNAERLANMLSGNIQGTNKEYCDLGRLYYGALKTMPAPFGDRARELYFIIQDQP